jgi:hypothetical protein
MGQERQLGVLPLFFGLALAWGSTALLISPVAVRLFGSSSNLPMTFVGQALMWVLAAAIVAIVLVWERQPLASLWLKPFRWQSIGWGLALAAINYALIVPVSEWLRHAVGLSGFTQGMERVSLLVGAVTTTFFIWKKDLLAMMVFHAITDATGFVIGPMFSEWWREPPLA